MNAADYARRMDDLVVVDAPPTGQLVPFLTAPSTFADLVRVGPMKRRAANVSAMLRSRARVVVVTIPEEMAIEETVEAVPAIRRTGVPVVAVVVNRIPPDIVAAFERHGFIWGGRWMHFDTMHFEFRPELLPAN